MKLLYLKVAKSDIDIPIKCLYIINKTLDNDRELLYNILYKHYGIRKVEILERIELESEDELPELIMKYTGKIDLRVFTKEGSNEKNKTKIVR